MEGAANTDIQLARADSYTGPWSFEAELWAHRRHELVPTVLTFFSGFSQIHSPRLSSGHDTKGHFEHAISSRLPPRILYRVLLRRNASCSDVETVCGSPIGKWRYWLTVLLCNRRRDGYPLGVFWRCDGCHNAIGILGNMESENWIFCSAECASECIGIMDWQSAWCDLGHCLSMREHGGQCQEREWEG